MLHDDATLAADAASLLTGTMRGVSVDARSRAAGAALATFDADRVLVREG